MGGAARRGAVRRGAARRGASSAEMGGDWRQWRVRAAVEGGRSGGYEPHVWHAQLLPLRVGLTCGWRLAAGGGLQRWQRWRRWHTCRLRVAKRNSASSERAVFSRRSDSCGTRSRNSAVATASDLKGETVREGARAACKALHPSKYGRRRARRLQGVSILPNMGRVHTWKKYAGGVCRTV